MSYVPDLPSRRAALKALGASAGVAAFVPWPETITPADDRSPGAKEARVADYVDLLLRESDQNVRLQWLGGKTATIHGYDTSEIGIHTERQYKGNQFATEFAADAAPFVSGGTQNTTWSILAICWRTMDILKERMKTGDV